MNFFKRSCLPGRFVDLCKGPSEILSLSGRAKKERANVSIWKSYIWTTDKDVNMKEIFAVMNTTRAVVKMRPEKKFRPVWNFFSGPYFNYSSSSVHNCEDLFHIHVFIHSSNIWLSYTHICLNSERLYLCYHNSKNTVVNETCSYLLPWPLPFCS